MKCTCISRGRGRGCHVTAQQLHLPVLHNTALHCSASPYSVYSFTIIYLGCVLSQYTSYIVYSTTASSMNCSFLTCYFSLSVPPSLPPILNDFLHSFLPSFLPPSLPDLTWTMTFITSLPHTLLHYLVLYFNRNLHYL